MGKVCLHFPLLGTGSIKGTNDAATALFQSNQAMDSLVREICQNSLDAKNRDLDASLPVRVKFELVKIQKKQYEIFKEYEDNIKRCCNYWEKNNMRTTDILDTVNNIKAYLGREEIPMLVMSDYNTNGLTGIDADETEKSFWHLLVDTEGISIKQDDTSLGSNGIGKNAPFLYSKLNLVFYNTLAKDGGRGFQGVTHLVTSQREYDGKLRATQPTGKYLYLEEEYTGRPILPDDNCDLNNISAFSRNENGTDVAVVGFDLDEYPDWYDETIISLLRNYTLAIMNGKLEADIICDNKKIHIAKETIADILYKDMADDERLTLTRQIYETISHPDNQDTAKKVCEDGDLSIYVKYGVDYEKCLARFRSTGMLINETKESFNNFSVVIVVNDVGECKLSKDLRKAEPPQHTSWAAKYVKNDKTLKGRVGRLLRKIMGIISDTLNEYTLPDNSEIVDAGAGNFLPSKNKNDKTGGDKPISKVLEVKKSDGTVICDSTHPLGSFEEAVSATGTAIPGYGIKASKKKRKHPKSGKAIIPVEPGNGNTKGVAAGRGNVRIIEMIPSDYRIIYMAANKYKLYINSRDNYDEVYLECYAGRDDTDKTDLVKIKNIKCSGLNKMDVNAVKAGPFPLVRGDNNIFIEFENHEYMGIIARFTRRVGASHNIIAVTADISASAGGAGNEK